MILTYAQLEYERLELASLRKALEGMVRPDLQGSARTAWLTRVRYGRRHIQRQATAAIRARWDRAKHVKDAAA